MARLLTWQRSATNPLTDPSEWDTDIRFPKNVVAEPGLLVWGSIDKLAGIELKNARHAHTSGDVPHVQWGGVPYCGPYYKGILLSGGLYSGSPIFLTPHVQFCWVTPASSKECQE